MTNVFLSWSGETSMEIAETLHKWIPSVLQFAKPYFTPKDIDKGAQWNTEISKKLSETHVGIICLTPDNFERPWILFEAGALSKDMERSKVCSVLFGIDSPELSGPLATFQTTAFKKTEFKKLIETINKSGGENSLSPDIFNEVFDMWWPKLEEKILKIIDESSKKQPTQRRSERDILEEILVLSRKNHVNDRSRASILPSGFVESWLESAEAILEVIEKDYNSAIENALISQVELIDFASDRTISHPKIKDRIAHLRLRASSIIPF